MKWFLPALGTSLVVLVLIFAAVEAKLAREVEQGQLGESPSSPAIESEPMELGAAASAETSSSSTIAKANVLSAPPPPPQRAPHREFEVALEAELESLRPLLLAHPIRRGLRELPPLAFDLDRIEVRSEERGVIDASFLASPAGDSVGRHRLDVRRHPSGEMMFRNREGSWLPLSQLESDGRLDLGALPRASSGTQTRYRYRGEHFQTLSSELVKIPLERRMERLEQESRVSRGFVTLFSIALLEEAPAEEQEGDLVCELIATDRFEQYENVGQVLRVPVRYVVARGGFEVKFEDRWHELRRWVNQIRPNAWIRPFHAPDDVPRVEHVVWELRG